MPCAGPIAKVDATSAIAEDIAQLRRAVQVEAGRRYALLSAERVIWGEDDDLARRSRRSPWGCRSEDRDGRALVKGLCRRRLSPEVVAEAERVGLPQRSVRERGRASRRGCQHH